VSVTICVIVTAYAAVNAYAKQQTAGLLAAENTSTQYHDAREALDIAKGEAKQARLELASLSEPLPAAELERLHGEADRRGKDAGGRANAESTDTKRGAHCGDICRAAERERDAAEKDRDSYNARIATARAKEAVNERLAKANERIEKANAEAEGGDAEPDAIAAWAAPKIGVEVREFERNSALVLSLLAIALTLSFAARMHGSVSLIVEGWRGEMIEVPEPEHPQAAEEEAAPVEIASVPENPVEVKPTEDAPVLDPGEWLKPRLRQQIGGKVDYDEFFTRYQQDASSQGMSAMEKSGLSRGLAKLGYELGGRSGRDRHIKNAALNAAKLSVVGS
jgi:hypothetical protein